MKLIQDLHDEALQDCARSGGCLALPVNLDDDPAREYLLFFTSEGDYELFAFDRLPVGGWAGIGSLSAAGEQPDRALVAGAVRQSRVQPVLPRYRDLQIGDVVFSLDPIGEH